MRFSLGVSTILATCVAQCENGIADGNRIDNTDGSTLACKCIASFDGVA